MSAMERLMCQPMLVVVGRGVVGMKEAGLLRKFMVPKTLLHEFGARPLTERLP